MGDQRSLGGKRSRYRDCHDSFASNTEGLYVAPHHICIMLFALSISHQARENYSQLTNPGFFPPIRQVRLKMSTTISPDCVMRVARPPNYGTTMELPNKERLRAQERPIACRRYSCAVNGTTAEVYGINVHKVGCASEEKAIYSSGEQD
jgi:hypothetical protein